MPEVTYDITTTELGREVESFDYYRENGFDYIIHNTGWRDWLKDPAWRENIQNRSNSMKIWISDFHSLRVLSRLRQEAGIQSKFIR